MRGLSLGRRQEGRQRGRVGWRDIARRAQASVDTGTFWDRHDQYRGTSLIRNCPSIGPYNRTGPRAL